MSICDQGLELGALPKVGRIGPVDDSVISAAAMGWQLFERQTQSKKAAFAECFGRDNRFVVFGHREKPRACEGSIVAEDSCFVSGGAIGRHLLFELVHTGLHESLGEVELQYHSCACKCESFQMRSQPGRSRRRPSLPCHPE
jgi:hypothetical protein